ncbi:MFS transporter, MCP family, solute carrier family 16 (monocarboxylic acid transporters), member 14 [Mytilus galloprovincialis]|uniref:MFS transporter, MCP family, solute carrier family 16 (Monocarboxylic acid transporters), member 14 n=1 Tax=Mytilus galloprovincialis TaxID=29158 RepID=A0A8B6CUL6_MYTGA|nr:MFS transporter, MCP family, solute carrier family 16 (monocarboxylic acid transporters), member 14 [Mytilus galloprovincialis]
MIQKFTCLQKDMTKNDVRKMPTKEVSTIPDVSIAHTGSGPSSKAEREKLKNDLTLEINPFDETSDGGWGWFIVVSSMIIHFIVAGLNRAAGILYLRFEEKFNKPASITAWVTSLSVSLTLAGGPVASALCNRFSYRWVVVAGGIVLAVSMVISALSPNLYVLFVSYGVIGGIGKTLAYGPGVVIVGMYFSRRRGIAVGLGTSGVALGAFAVPTLVEFSFSEYGYFGAFIIMTGIALQLVVCGFLLRPLSLHKQITEYDRRKLQILKWNEDNKKHAKSLPTDTVHRPCKISVKDSYSFAKASLKVDEKNKETKQNGKFCDFSLLRNNRFSSLCAAVVLFNVSYQSSMIFLPALSEKLGIDEFESFPVVVVGICDGLGRIISGFLFDRKCIKPIRCYIYNAALFCLGVTTMFIPLVRNTTQFGIVCAILGLFLGNGVSQQSVVIVDILGEENLSCGFGILILFQGIGTFIGPPLSGLLKDINGSYDYAFYLGGVCAIFGAAIFMGANIVHYKLEKQMYTIESQDQLKDQTHCNCSKL